MGRMSKKVARGISKPVRLFGVYEVVKFSHMEGYLARRLSSYYIGDILSGRPSRFGEYKVVCSGQIRNVLGASSIGDHVLPHIPGEFIGSTPEFTYEFFLYKYYLVSTARKPLLFYNEFTLDNLWSL